MKKLLLMMAAIISASWVPVGHAQVGDVLRRAQDKAQKAKKVADIYKPWTPEQEHAVGEAAAAKMVHIFGIYDNPDMTRYVNLVGNTVARQAPREVPYHFAILDTEIVTALSLPGGYVFLTRGALANMRNEAELARHPGPRSSARRWPPSGTRDSLQEIQSVRKRRSCIACAARRGTCEPRRRFGERRTHHAGESRQGKRSRQSRNGVSRKGWVRPCRPQEFPGSIGASYGFAAEQETIRTLGQQSSSIPRARRYADNGCCEFSFRRKSSNGTLQLVCKSGQLREEWNIRHGLRARIERHCHQGSCDVAERNPSGRYQSQDPSRRINPRNSQARQILNTREEERLVV